MGTRSFSTGVVAAAAVASALVASSLSSNSLLGPRPDRAPLREVPVMPGARQGASSTNGVSIPTWLVTSMTVLLTLYALILLILALSGRRVQREPVERLDLGPDEPAAEGVWNTVLAADLDNAVQAQLAALQQGSPRNAIVACWLALQTATWGAGLVEVRTDTSEEFMLRAVRDLGLDRPAILALSRLYREARFSDHVMMETHRQQAGQALEVLADQLARLGLAGASSASTERVWP